MTEQTPTPENLTAYVYLDTCSGQRFVTSEKITRRTLHEFLGEVAIDSAAIKNPLPELPTEPGRYVDRDGDDDWLLHADGRWFRDGSVVFGTRMHAVAPFTRLAPERPQVTVDEIQSAITNIVRTRSFSAARLLSDIHVQDLATKLHATLTNGDPR